jgi:hypothetical protein
MSSEDKTVMKLEFDTQSTKNIQLPKYNKLIEYLDLSLKKFPNRDKDMFTRNILNFYYTNNVNKSLQSDDYDIYQLMYFKGYSIEYVLKRIIELDIMPTFCKLNDNKNIFDMIIEDDKLNITKYLFNNTQLYKYIYFNKYSSLESYCFLIHDNKNNYLNIFLENLENKKSCMVPILIKFLSIQFKNNLIDKCRIFDNVLKNYNISIFDIVDYLKQENNSYKLILTC